jgi:SAM-dependent MidA family methyltransferase
MDRIAGALNTGYVVTIDYGYTAGELPRFPRGTLMSYRRHQAIEDVLSEPGSQDITAHVCFTALDEYGASRGLAKEFFEPLERTLMRAGEEDHFAAALGADSAADELRRRLQLKQLLFGMGQTFRTLIQRKAGSK